MGSWALVPSCENTYDVWSNEQPLMMVSRGMVGGKGLRGSEETKFWTYQMSARGAGAWKQGVEVAG